MSGATEMQGMIVVSYSLIIILSLLSLSPRTSPFHLLFLGWEEGKRRKQEGLCLTTLPPSQQEAKGTIPFHLARKTNDTPIRDTSLSSYEDVHVP